MKFYFRPDFNSIDTISSRTVNEIKNELMLFSANTEFAKTAGPITKEFVDILLKHYSNDNWIIDSRVHMLMPGWYPCIPGWHHDDIPRSRSDGQPNYRNPEYNAEHVMAIVDCGTGSLTEFINEEVILNEVPLNEIVYKKWNQSINSMHINYISIANNSVVRFGNGAFHRGVPANSNGWRFFIRATRNTNRLFLNEFRKQVQVYMSALEAGW